jgi:hypothetical protein
VTTEAHAEPVTTLATRLGKAHVVVSVRFDLYEAEWGRLRGQDVYVIVADARFAHGVAEYLEREGAREGAHVLVNFDSGLLRVDDDVRSLAVIHHPAVHGADQIRALGIARTIIHARRISRSVSDRLARNA